MTSVARRPTGSLTVPEVPRLSPMLEAVVNHASSSTYSPPVFIPARFQEMVSQEAGRAADILRQRMAPADANRWQSFLFPLRATVRNPPSSDGFQAFVGAVAAALINIPAHLLTPARQREGIRRFQFWPSAADIASWLEPEARDDRAMLGALERTAAAPEPTVEQHEATEAAIAHVKAAAEGFRAETKAREKAQREAERVMPAAAYLTPDQLRVALNKEVAAGGVRAVMAELQLKALEDRA